MSETLLWSQAVLQTTPERWLKLAQSLPEELMARAPASGEWSALECLQHLVDTERWVFPVRVVHLLEGRDFPAFDPDSQGTRPDAQQDALSLAEQFAGLRQESLALWDRLSTQDLDRQARHQELGIVTLRELLNEWAGHDLMHTVQAERALMQPFIEGCGPWQSYFADHAVAGDG